MRVPLLNIDLLEGEVKCWMESFLREEVVDNRVLVVRNRSVVR